MCMIDRLFCSGNLTIGSSVVGNFIDGCGGMFKSALKHPSASTTSLYQSHSSNWPLERILRISSISRWVMASSIILASSIIFLYNRFFQGGPKRVGGGLHRGGGGRQWCHTVCREHRGVFRDIYCRQGFFSGALYATMLESTIQLRMVSRDLNKFTKRSGPQ